MKFWHCSLLVFGGGCSYGVVSTLVKLAYREGFAVDAVTGSQYVCGAAMAWLAVRFVPRAKLTARQWAVCLACGVPMGLTGIFYNYALEHIPASLAIILLLQFTWISALMHYLLARRPPKRPALAAIAVILVGSALAGGVFRDTAAFSGAGVGWGLLAAASFAAFIYGSSRDCGDIHPVYKSAVMTSGAMVCVFAVMPPLFLANGDLAAGLWRYGLATGLFASLIPPLLFAAGMPVVRELGGILSASELPTAVLMSALVLGEPVSGGQWAGVALILAGIALPYLWQRLTGTA